MTSLSPRPSNRLDWIEFWRRYDERFTPTNPEHTRSLAHFVPARAREAIQEICESMIADREGALNP